MASFAVPVGVTVGVTVCRTRTRTRTLHVRCAGIRGRRLRDGHERRRAGLDRDPEPTSDGVRGNRVAEGVPREDTNRRDAPASDGAVEPLSSRPARRKQQQHDQFQQY